MCVFIPPFSSSSPSRKLYNPSMCVHPSHSPPPHTYTHSHVHTGELVTKQPLIASMRVVKKETLKLISCWVSKSQDPGMVRCSATPNHLCSPYFSSLWWCPCNIRVSIIFFWCIIYTSAYVDGVSFQVREHFLPPLLDAILGDYRRNVPQAREPEVLSTVTAIVEKMEVRWHSIHYWDTLYAIVGMWPLPTL